MKKQTLSRFPESVPQSYQQLSRFHHLLLTATAFESEISMERLVEALKVSRLIEDFRAERHLPKTMTWDDAVNFLGITNDRWHDILKKTTTTDSVRKGGTDWKSVRPWTIRGGADPGPAQPWDMEAVYWTDDILRMDEFLLDQADRALPKCSRLEKAFRTRLCRLLSTVKMAVKPTAPEEDLGQPLVLEEWPKDLPHNNNELVAMYGDYVFSQVRYISKIKTEGELEEVCQETWKALLGSRVLEKFIHAAQTKLPRTLTLDEVCNYLGITVQQWLSAMSYHKRSKSGWMPAPVKGKPFSKASLYLTEDIQTLDESGFLKDRRNNPRRNPEVTGRGFKSYLSQAVRNHFKNLIRTRTRRHKERALDPKTVLAQDSSGLFHKATMLENGSAWEELLTDADKDSDMESMIDLACQLRKNGVDPHTDYGLSVLDAMMRGLSLQQAIRSLERMTVRQAACA